MLSIILKNIKNIKNPKQLIAYQDNLPKRCKKFRTSRDPGTRVNSVGHRWISDPLKIDSENSKNHSKNTDILEKTEIICANQNICSESGGGVVRRECDQNKV